MRQQTAQATKQGENREKQENMHTFMAFMAPFIHLLHKQN